jgi:hypothetical protein
MGEQIKRHLVDPVVIAIGAVGVTGAIIIGIGNILLSLYKEYKGVDSFDRWELWFALGLALAVIAVGALVSGRPKSRNDVLDKEVVLGRREFFEEPLPPVSAAARSGPEGTVNDITDGYTLYATNGALATAQGLIPGGSDYGRRFSGFIYAHGLHGASDELWIPFEAVTAVYPETKSAFLAVKGDETEFFGWNYPPENLRRGPSTEKDPLRPVSQ